MRILSLVRPSSLLESLLPVLLATIYQGDAARGAQHINQKMALAVTPAGVLDVREFSGDMAVWRTERVLNAPELLHFRWKTAHADATSSTWRVTRGSLTGTLVASGSAGATPAPGAVRFFNVDFRAILPPEPLETPRVYWVVLGITLATGRELPSTAVKLTYARPSGNTTTFTDEGLDKPLEPIVESVRQQFGMIAMGGAVIRKNGWMKVGVSGFRRHDYPTRVAQTDRWHIGSDTKAMTATLAAVLVDRNVIEWGTTLGQTFPELQAVMSPGFRGVTLLQLLRHRGGMPKDPGEYGNDILDHRDISNTTRRYLLTKAIVVGAPAQVPGGRWVYSNMGYMVAAAMLEKRAGRAWEDLMRTELFAPLRMQHVGFGPPESELRPVGPGSPHHLAPRQPWGHGQDRKVWTGGIPAAAPAGDVHASLRDWGRFVLLHLNGREGNLQLADGSLSQLHTAQVDLNPLASYACGWLRSYPDTGVLSHDGCNTFWYARAIVDKVRGYGLLVTTNVADPDCDASVKAVDALALRLQRYLGY